MIIFGNEYNVFIFMCEEYMMNGRYKGKDMFGYYTNEYINIDFQNCSL